MNDKDSQNQQDMDNGESEKYKHQLNWSRFSLYFSWSFLVLAFMAGYFFDHQYTINGPHFLEILKYIGTPIYSLFLIISVIFMVKNNFKLWAGFKINLMMLMAPFVLIYLYSLFEYFLKSLSFQPASTGGNGFFIAPNLDYLGTLLQFM